MSRGPSRRDTAEIIADADVSLLELVDNLLTKGVLVTGEVMLGLAGVDLVYVRLSTLLCAADRVIPTASVRTRHRLEGAPRSRPPAAPTFAPASFSPPVPPTFAPRKVPKFAPRRAPKLAPRTPPRPPPRSP